MSIESRVHDIIRDQFSEGTPCVLSSSRLSEDLLLDSLDAVEILMAAEDEFDIDISDSDFMDIAGNPDATVSDVVALVAELA